MPCHSKSIYKLSAISSRMPESYFLGSSKTDSEYIEKGKPPGIASITLKVKNKMGGLAFPTS